MSFILFFALSGFAAPVSAEDADARACGLPYAVVELMTFVSDSAEFSNGASRIAQGALGLTIEKIELQGHVDRVGSKLGDDAKTALMTLMDIARSIIRGELPPEQGDVLRHTSVLKEAGQAPCLEPTEAEPGANGTHDKTHSETAKAHTEPDQHDTSNEKVSLSGETLADAVADQDHDVGHTEYAPEPKHEMSQPVHRDPSEFGTNLFTHDRPLHTHITKKPQKNADLIITDPAMLPEPEPESEAGDDVHKDEGHATDQAKDDGHDDPAHHDAHSGTDHAENDAAMDDHAVADETHASDAHGDEKAASDVDASVHAEAHSPIEDAIVIALIVLGGLALGARALMGVKDPSECKVAVKMATDDDTELFGYATSMGRKEFEFGSSVGSTVSAFSELATSLPKDVIVDISGEEHAGQLEWVAAGGAKVKFKEPLKKKQLSAALAWSTLEKEVRKFSLSLPFGKKAKPA